MQLITYTSRLYSIHIHIPTTPMPTRRRGKHETRKTRESMEKNLILTTYTN